MSGKPVDKMTTDIYIQAQADYLEKISKASPINAISEIIWNSLDADAKNISIKYLGNEISTETIEIIDDGGGFNYELAVKTFGELGGSWKRARKFTQNGRRQTRRRFLSSLYRSRRTGCRIFAKSRSKDNRSD
jgi:hypothetical protein